MSYATELSYHVKVRKATIEKGLNIYGIFFL